jgi:UDP-galactopyranose mutase
VQSNRSIDPSKYALIIVGSGLFGSTVGRLIVEEFNIPVLVLEKRNHPGGNSWSEIDSETGIEFHTYGSHLFHTSNQRVWDFINRFSEFTSYRHRVVAKHKNKYFDIPINLQTLSNFFDYPFTPTEAKEFLSKFHIPNDKSVSFEELARGSIGDALYEAFFMNYTKKQWQIDPKLLPGEIFRRIPIRFSFNNDYFDDAYQGLPKDGYGKLISNLLNHPLLHVSLNTDFFDLRPTLKHNRAIVYTGPLDRYFNYSQGVLGWRTLDFEREVIDVKDFQGTSVVNYVDADVNYTRVHEFKHLHPERRYLTEQTLIMREYSRFAQIGDDPYYPINSSQDRKVLESYRELAKKEKGVFFGGRLGSYLYLDMHMAIASAINLFENSLKDYIRIHLDILSR